MKATPLKGMSSDSPQSITEEESPRGSGSVGLTLVLVGSLFVCKPPGEAEPASLRERAPRAAAMAAGALRPRGGGESRGGKQGQEESLYPWIGSDSTFFFFF